MSPEITLHGHRSKGHDKCQPVPVQTERQCVQVNGKAVACVGDELQSHSCDNHDPHQGKISKGAPYVHISGRPVVRKGDTIDCGPAQDELAEGFATVRVGNCGGEEYGRELIFGMLTSPQD